MAIFVKMAIMDGYLRNQSEGQDMRTISATNAKNRLGEALSFADEDSLMIEKNSKEAYMAFSATMGRRMVLSSYRGGAISRATAMNLLGLDWYGDLLDALAKAGIERPVLAAQDMAPMVQNAAQALERL